MKNENKLYKSLFLGPFTYLKPSVRTEGYIVLFLLMLQVLMLVITKSFSSLFVIFFTLAASFLADFSAGERNFRDSFIIISCLIRGIIIGLLIPQNFPPFTVFIITFSVLFINKKIFGGFANSWINPVAAIVAVCWIIGTKFFPEVQLASSSLQSRNIALSLIQNGTFQLNSFDVVITNFLNKRIFSFFGVSIPEGYFSLFWDSHANIPAFRFNLLTLVSSIILFGTDVLNPIIPLFFIITYGFLVKVFAPVFYSGTIFNGDLLLAFLTSGTLFCTFFLLQWHGTTPFSNRGRAFYGFFSGIIAFFILGIGLSPAGFAFIILTINIISLFIQSVENHFLKDYTKNILMPQVRLIKEGCDA